MSYPWWRHSVVYQIYIRSFADGNGDGTGDIAGIISRLGYLESLGVDAIWVNPWYSSPLKDGGYDVADYREIHPDFGTMGEARDLFGEAERHGIKVIVDLVPNHTSDQHRWFLEAIEAGPGSPSRNRYHFLKGRGAEGELPPNNWTSVFGGPAWTRLDDGEWYLHMFDASQPDLNWEHPDVLAEFDSILRFWLDAGASGFRVDVAHALIKASGYPDAAVDTDEALRTPDEDHPLWDQPELHDIVRRWRAVVDEYDDRVMVAEAWLPTWSTLSQYVRSDEYHQTFDFLFLQSDWSARELRATVRASLEATTSVGSIPSWVLSNHDVIRHATRYGLPVGSDAREWLNGDRTVALDEELGLRRARAAALLMLALPGSVYLYQGEELGLHEVHDLPEQVLEDPVWVRSRNTDKGRDGCRVPIPWERSGDSFGFGADGSWLPQPSDWGDVSVEAQTGDTTSTLEMYRQALAIRRKRFIEDETIEWLDEQADVVTFRRGAGVVCMVNIGVEPCEMPAGELLIASGPVEGSFLPPDTAAWVDQTTVSA